MKKTKEYLKKDYTFVLKKEGDEYFGEIEELEGCYGDGSSPDECVERLERAKYYWIKAALEMGKEIPSPREQEEDFSGRILIRIPKTLHWRIARSARREGVSINQFLLSVITQGLTLSEVREPLHKSEDIKPSTAPIKYKQEEEGGLHLVYSDEEIAKTA